MGLSGSYKPIPGGPLKLAFTAGLRKGSFSGNEMNIFITSFEKVTDELSYILISDSRLRPKPT